ncbi:MAG: hypothetical protein EPN86_01100 [Nanoarchaeota archaeon]|nr:MAG: hypothetical protein EPN86_01100 [Nanoarchaeota archaeon]
MALLSGADLLYNVRKYYSPSREEVEAFAISVAAMIVIVAFNDGRPTFEWGHWLYNLLISALVVVVASVVFISAQRIFALWWGYKAELKIFFPGIAVGLLLTLMTFGAFPWLWWLGMHGIQVHILEPQRLGYFRFFTRLWDVAFIALAGPVALIMLAIFFRMFYFLPNTEVLQQAVRITIIYAFYQMLPIPPLAGHNILFASRWIYVMTLGIIISLGILLVFPAIPFILAVAGALILGLMSIIVFFKVIEPRVM